MKFDSVLPLIGEFGRYQRRIYLLLCLPAICCAMHKLAWLFLGAKIGYRCKLPFETDDANFTLPDDIHYSMVYNNDSQNAKGGQCEMLKTNFTEEYFLMGIPANESESCNEFIYDRSKYQSSARIDYQMFCDQENLYAHAQSLFMVGILIGSILFGDLSDRFGRRPIFFLSLVLQVVFGILAGLAPNYWTFVFARMMVGSSTSGIFLVGFVLAMEMVGPSKRMVAGVVCQFFFTAGYLVTALFAYLIRDWKVLQIALSLPGLIFLSYYWFLPESIRWLLARGRKEEASATLRKAAKENNVLLPEDVYESLCDEPVVKSSVNILHLFRYPRLGLRSCNIFLSWFVNSGVYYGLSLNTSNLGGNDYINFVIAGAVEVPAYSFLLVSLNRFGRKIILCGCMVAGGLCMAACALVPEKEEWNLLVITLAMLGKMCITASYGVIYIFSAENFPTVVRNAGVGASSMFARVGGIFSIYLLDLKDYWKPLPLLIFGAASLISGLLALLIPETVGKRLPETMEDGEKFGTKEYENRPIELTVSSDSPNAKD